ncbi:MAG: AAA family ATPase, partial [Epsilonproteobacteria bacterium]|nr:AAA family ATPase [Campylobacterota bacterium]
MKQRWTLNIHDFGKIKEAHVEIAPFVLFVGENNSGKSYLVSLLWGLLAQGRFLFPKEVPSSEAYGKCSSLIFENLHNENFELVQDNFSLIVDWFNTVLKSKKNELIKKVFSNDALSIGQLYLSDFSREKPLAIKWQAKEDDSFQRISSGVDYVRFPIDKENLTEIDKYKIIQYITWKLIMDDLSSPLFPMSATMNKRAGGEALYLPAARTGFMLTYKSLTSELMNSWAMDGEIQSRFTLPVVRFLQGLIESKQSEKAKFSEIAEFLENRVLDGKIISKEEIIADYSYMPKSAKKALPFYLTSSLVVELSPLIIFLNSKVNYRSLIIEEPEAHLHPKMQRVITQAMARLVNKGLPIWCTTHSDTILQQVNNLIKLFNHKDKKELMQKFGYEKEDLINPNDIKAYQFVVDRQTIVKPLK